MSASSTADLDTLIRWGAVLVEMAGALTIVAAGVRGAVAVALTLGDTSGLIRSRLILTDGILAALGLKTAATLLKTLELRSWSAIASFAAVLAVRTFVKQGLAWEMRRVQANARRRETSIETSGAI